MLRFSMTLLSAVVVTTVSANAQECSQILSQGIYDIRSSANDLNTASSFSQWFCDKKFSSSQQANDFGASLAFPFKGIPVKLGFDSNSQRWSEWYSSFCGSVQHDQSLQNRVREHVQTVNPQIVQAFNSCLELDGLHVWLERTYDPKRFRFAARFNPPNANNPKATIEAFKPGPNVSCDDKPKTIDRPVWRTECKRTNDDPVSVIVRADWDPKGGGKLELPAIVHIDPPPPPPPVKKLNPLFAGQTPNCNASIVTNHQNHLNCTNTPLGYTIESGQAAQQRLYLGVTGNVNAGVITTKSNFRGGATQEWGYTIREAYKAAGSSPLYVVVGCGNNDGEVTTNPGHKNCPTAPIGWTYPW